MYHEPTPIVPVVFSAGGALRNVDDTAVVLQTGTMLFMRIIALPVLGEPQSAV